jgi:hypothetical protein
MIKIRWEDEEGNYIYKEVDPVMSRIGRQRRRVFAFCEALKDRDLDFWMITLTYRTGDDFGLRDITDFIRRLKRRVDIKAYTWVMEMQERGVPHYHLVVAVRKGVKIKKPDKNGMWKEGMTSVEKANTVWYVAKYTGKMYQKVGLPKYFHMYAIWICERILQDLESFRRWNLKKSSYPIWLVRILDSRLDWMERGVAVERCKGGGWWVDNMKFDSPYIVVF